MALQESDAVRNAGADALETTIGATPVLTIYNGTPPADETAALSGNTVLASGTLPSDWLTAASAGVKNLAGSWNITGQSGAGAGTAGTFFRILQGATPHLQGTFGATTSLNTNAAHTAPSNVLSFASTTGVALGMLVSHASLPADTRVHAFDGTTVTLTRTPTSNVTNGNSVTFSYDLATTNNSIANAQAVSVTSFTYTRGN